ncbi:MAG: hypothetical protein JNK74_06800 [Candidatus Hydrogenedentes bacterium]|nr:hypothetical protein [Candidatus Hydrogenedentota bacterium]
MMGEKSRFIEEDLAKDMLHHLTKSLSGAEPAVSLSISGFGVHWHIDASAGARTCHINCFNYVADGLRRVKRMRKREASRFSFRDISRKYPGAEFLIVFRDVSDRACEERTSERDPEGRFYTSKAVVACIRRWVLDVATKDDLYEAFPCVDIRKRALLELVGYVTSYCALHGISMRIEIEPGKFGDGGEVRIEGTGRLLRIDASRMPEDRCFRCTVELRNTVVGSVKAASFPEIAKAAQVWIVEEASVTGIGSAVPQLTIHPYADFFERGDYAGWHWNREIHWAREDRKSCESQYMACYLPLLELLGADPVTRRFFTFTSMGRLAFSRCSEYPYATAGMPWVWADRSAYPKPLGYSAGHDRHCSTCEVEGDAGVVFQFLKRYLANVWESGVYGELVHALIEPANYILTEQGSALGVLQGEARDVAFARAVEGGRTCTLMFAKDKEPSIFLVTFDRESGKPMGHAYCHRMIQVVALMRRWLEFHQEPDSFMALADEFMVYGD